MEEQIQDNPAIVPVKAKSGLVRTIIISAIVSALVSSVVFLALQGSLVSRVSVLEKQMAKQMATYKAR